MTAGESSPAQAVSRREKLTKRMRDFRRQKAADAAWLANERDRKRAARARETSVDKIKRRLKDKVYHREVRMMVTPGCVGNLSSARRSCTGILKGVLTTDQLVNDVALREAVVERAVQWQSIQSQVGRAVYPPCEVKDLMRRSVEEEQVRKSQAQAVQYCNDL